MVYRELEVERLLSLRPGPILLLQYQIASREPPKYGEMAQLYKDGAPGGWPWLTLADQVVLMILFQSFLMPTGSSNPRPCGNWGKWASGQSTQSHGR